MKYEEKADNRTVGRWIDLTGECLLGSPGQTVSCAVRFGTTRWLMTLQRLKLCTILDHYSAAALGFTCRYMYVL